ncbi:MAG: CDP-alcohol phosphatidyltransferase family protein [Chloroflexota bacterium]
MNNIIDKAILPKGQSKGKLADIRQTLARSFTGPIVRLLAHTGIHPNGITWFGFLLTLAAALLIILGYFPASGVIVLVAGFCDSLDGALARHTGRVTRYGAVLDSTLDRASEGVLLLAILVFYLAHASERPVIIASLVGAALIGSYLVSYIRARAEGMGLTCTVGISTRTERVVVMVLGLLFNQIMIALVVIALFSLFTAGQRLAHVRQQTKGDK